MTPIAQASTLEEAKLHFDNWEQEVVCEKVNWPQREQKIVYTITQAQEFFEPGSTWVPSGRETEEEKISDDNTVDPMTYWKQAVWINFNPSNRQDVQNVKLAIAFCIDMMDALRKQTETGEVKRLASHSITVLQDASMRAVKSLTWDE